MSADIILQPSKFSTRAAYCFVFIFLKNNSILKKISMDIINTQKHYWEYPLEKLYHEFYNFLLEGCKDDCIKCFKFKEI